MLFPALEKLNKFYSHFSGDDNVLILINADPDAIASAMAVKRLLWHRVAGVTISRINVIKRPDNLAMIRLLGANLVHIEEIDKNKYSRFVIVDSQPGHNEAFTAFKYDIVIDHHPETDTDAGFKDIRPGYGATASIMTEYLRAARIKPSYKLATALYYAIKTDTSDFERKALVEDVRAFQFLFRHANIHIARKIEQAELSFDFLKYFKYAFENMRKRKDRIFVHTGQVINPDVCVLLADFFMRINSIKWSIVSGVCGNHLVVIFRNDGLRKNAGRVAKESFGHIGSAGGHKSMARAEIPISALNGHPDLKSDEMVLKWIIAQIEKRAGKK
ncbi:MAG: phosphoesterase [Desulfobacteraceae bacterium]|nr:MAG: phosphoesterase [Desulfobacteraceae bacterium]